LLANGRPLASSLGGGVEAWEQVEPRAAEVEGIPAPVTFTLNGQPYYAARLSLVDGTLVDEIALNVADIAATERGLILLLIGSIALVASAGSALGVLLARRIGQPLTQLADAAQQPIAGQLDQPIVVQSQITEVAQLAESLERARVGLRESLNELRQAKEWTDSLLEAISEGIVTLDQDGRITFFSPGAQRITGWPPEEVLGRSLDQVFSLVGSNAPFSQFLPPPGRASKVTVALSGDRQATLSVTGARLTPPDTDQAGVALVFRDVSESELVHRLMGEFLANITHEFRTPLSALAASAELLFDQAHDFSPEELDELLISLHLGIVGLQTLVDNLLEGARLEIGQFRVHPRPADLAEIIGEATRIMRPLQDKHHQRLAVELPVKVPMVQADSRRIVQVLVNLLSNAIKYSPDDTEIAIRVAPADGWVRLSVSDQGPGIPAAYRSSLFRRFAHPEPSPDKGQYGAGLGLSVVKAIVEAHGGQVGLEECSGGGSTFWFTLPMLDGS
jgi:PAS domain S-box-containing protein